MPLVDSFFTLSTGPGETTAKKARMEVDQVTTQDPTTGLPIFQTVYDEVASIVGPDGRLTDFNEQQEQVAQPLLRRILIELRLMNQLIAAGLNVTVSQGYDLDQLRKDEWAVLDNEGITS